MFLVTAEFERTNEVLEEGMWGFKNLKLFELQGKTCRLNGSVSMNFIQGQFKSNIDGHITGDEGINVKWGICDIGTVPPYCLGQGGKEEGNVARK